MYIAKLDGNWKVISEDGNSYLDGKVANSISMNNGKLAIENAGVTGKDSERKSVDIAASDVHDYNSSKFSQPTCPTTTNP